MRIALNSKPTVIFGAIFVVALIVLLPLRLAAGWFGLGDVGLTARQVRGSVWAGTMDEAALARVPLGDLDARLSPLPLVVGQARVAVRGRGAASGSHGAITLSRHSIGIADVTAGLSPGSIFAPVPVSQLDLSAVGVRFEDGRCVHAEGRVHAAIGGDIAGVDLGGGLSGDARCDKDVLLLPLVSASGAQRILLRIAASGRYHADLTVQPPDDPTALPKLLLSGFRPGPQGYVLAVEGRF